MCLTYRLWNVNTSSETLKDSYQNDMDLTNTQNVGPLQRLSYQCVKILMFFFNAFFWLLGWTVIGIGLSIHKSIGFYSFTVDKEYTSSSIGDNSASELCLVIGAIIVLVVSLGCCGTHTENQLILSVYLSIVCVLLSFEIGAILVATFHREKFEQHIMDDIKLTMNSYEMKNFEEITKSIDDFQKVFQCCGCIYYTDWYNTTWGKNHRFKVPKSCLKIGPGFESLDIRTTINPLKSYINTQGCFKQITSYFMKNVRFFQMIVVFLLGVQMIGVICTSYLLMKRKYKWHKTYEKNCYRMLNSNHNEMN